jgi:hypothetical protein
MYERDVTQLDMPQRKKWHDQRGSDSALAVPPLLHASLSVVVDVTIYLAFNAFNATHY